MNRTEQEKEFICLLGQLREKGQPGDYMAVILAVEALAAGHPGIVIDKHRPDIQAASNADLEAAIEVLQSSRIKREGVAPGTTDAIIKYTRGILKERMEAAV
jgi:hypothetical protein